ncbi:hypothetical protein WG66_014995 [Moniliophthora roreri]|uniref:Putative P-loop containing nucleoside triphosphate hydrolase protein n=1 Tax=Moniliophthora roreri TaxID=221103 RepID=A0A0W0FFJ5_MONRR|nr:hypothetical protein WG66_014995 [Moniliophthora roreri]
MNPSPATLATLFSFLTRRQLILFLIPAILSSICSGFIPPIMTVIVGQVFQAFSLFPLPPTTPTSDDKRALLHSVGMSAVQLVGLATASVALSSLSSFFWVSVAERNTKSLRLAIYTTLIRRPMAFYDSRDPGALLASFTNDADSVRLSTGLASGLLIQHLTTTIVALVLAFTQSPLLTLLTLSAIPLLTIVQAISQVWSARFIATERDILSSLTSHINTTLSLLPTIRLFNLAQSPLRTLADIHKTLTSTDIRINTTFAISSSMTELLIMAMFVQAFWFGSTLVRQGKIDVGGVMAVFWACLVASSNLQMAVAQLAGLQRGRVALGGLYSKEGLLAEGGSGDEEPQAPSTPTFPRFKSGMKKIHPAAPARGELTLHGVSFSYPNAEAPALQDVEMFIPAGEMTFLVGASGSGKSSLTGLLAGFYQPNNGQILLDDQDLPYLSPVYVTENVGIVSQGIPPIIPGESIHFNISIGAAHPEMMTRGQIVDACRAALLHDFIRDLPDGYDTVLGAPSTTSSDKQEFEGGVPCASGVYLSPGQLQRLSLARAYLRNPPVLILDEPTSALDPVGRELVMSALKKWRKGKTTVVIGHEFGDGETATIQPIDFVYVMKDGQVAECGFRADLEGAKEGEFSRLLRVQRGEEKDADAISFESDQDEQEVLPTYRQSQLLEEKRMSAYPNRLTIAASGAVAGWMLDVVNDLTSAASNSTTTLPRRNTLFPPVPPLNLTNSNTKLRRTSSFELSPITTSPTIERRRSLQFTPTSPTFHYDNKDNNNRASVEDDLEFEQEKGVLEMSGRMAQKRPTRRTRPVATPALEITVSQPLQTEETHAPPPGLFKTIGRVYPTVERRGLPIIALGLVCALASGAMIPIFSFLLSRLLFLVSTIPANSPASASKEEVNKWGGIVLSIVVLDSAFIGLKFWLNECESGRWVCRVRERVLGGLVGVSRTWWDADKERTPQGMVPVMTTTLPLIRPLLSLILPQSLTTLSILSISLLLALIRGWELTLTGIALVPVFLGVMTIQGRLVASQEQRILAAKNRITSEVLLFVSAIKGIRGAHLQPTYTTRMNDAVGESCRIGVRGAFVEGATLGIASALIYLSEGVLFYVGAVLVAGGRVEYSKMVETLNLVVFAVSIGGQGVGFVNKIAKTLEATDQIMTLLNDIEASPRDTIPKTIPPSNGQGYEICFDTVSFAYPSAPTERVLKDVSFTLRPGELVAVVGSSGGGKSTLSGLLEGELQPTSGRIVLRREKDDDEYDLKDVDVRWWREQMGVVEQGNTLFPEVSVAENLFSSDVEYDWLADIPKDKAKAKELSGGQAQRVMIARALERSPRAKVLVMDEPTSALDPVREEKVLHTLQSYVVEQQGRMGLMVTHRLPAMKAVDRILVLDGGRVVQEGAYDELIEEEEGVFKRLASGGVWMS